MVIRILSALILSQEFFPQLYELQDYSKRVPALFFSALSRRNASIAGKNTVGRISSRFIHVRTPVFSGEFFRFPYIFSEQLKIVQRKSTELKTNV
jgi:hypothetical protein